MTVPLCAVFVLVHTQWGRERMRDAAIEAIRSELGLTATLDEVEVAFFPLPRVSARGIRLDDPVYGRFAEADGLTIKPSLWALAFGRLDLDTIELDSPVVHLVVREGEIRNLPRVRGASSGSGDLPFSHLEATNASVTVDADPYLAVALESAELVIDVVGERELDLTLEVRDGRVDHARGSEILQRLDAAVYIDPDEGIDIDELTLWTPFVKLGARDGHLPLPVDEGYYGHAYVRVNLAHLERLPHGWDLPPMRGIAQIDANVEGTPEGPVGHGTVDVERGIIDDRGIGDLHVPFEIDAEEVRLVDAEMRIVGEGGVTTVDGSIGLGDGFPVELTVDIERLRFVRLMEQLAVSDNAIVQWPMNATVTLRGTLDPVRLDGPIRLEGEGFMVTRDAWHAHPQRRVVGVERYRIAGRVALRANSLQFNRLIANTPRSRLFGDVHLGFDDTLRVDVHGQIDLQDPSPLLDFPLGGEGSVSVEVRGTFSDPIVTGRLAFADFSFNTFGLGSVESAFTLEEDGLAVRFPRVDALKRDSVYRVDDLYLDFTQRRFSIEGDLRAQRFTLADFYHVFHYEEDERFTDYQGVVAGDAHLRYTLDHPQDGPNGTLVADMDLAIAEADINGFRFTDGELRGRWRWVDWTRGADGGELDIAHLHLRKGRGVVTVDGRMGLDGVLQMNAAADRIAVRDTEGLADRMPDLGGVYSVVGDIAGTIEVPRANLDVNLSGLSYKNAMLGDGRAYVRLTDRQDPWIRAAEGWDPGNLPDEACAAGRNGLWRGRCPDDPPLRTVEGPKPRLVTPMAFVVCGEGLGGQIALDLAIGRTQVYPLRGSIDLAGLELEPFLRDYQDGAPLTGEMSGRIALSGGAMLAPETLSGRVRLTHFRVGQPRVELRNSGDVDVRIARGAFEVASADFTGPGSRVGITGGGSSREGLALTIDGEVDLGLVAQLSPRFTHAGGQLGVHVNVSGQLRAPSIYGRALVRRGEFRYAGFSEPLTDMRGQITFSARRVLFEDFSARMASGRIAMSGAATLRGQGIDRYEFDIEGRDVSLAPEMGVSVALGGRARLAWNREQRLPLLTGTLRLGRVSYERDIEMEALSLDGLSRQARAEIEQYDPDEDRVEMDLRIVDDSPIRVSNNLIDADVRIEDSERPFRIVGTDQRFGAVGTLEIPRGTVNLRDTEFEIRRGRVDFEDTQRLDPNFDVVAETEVRRSGELSGPNWRISLHAHGNSDSFRLDTTSQPELSQEDIVLLLTVGMTRAEADQLQAGDVGGTIALEALTTVTGLDREVQRALPVIDDFQITSRYSTTTGRTEPQLSIGKRITDRVRLTASSGIGESQEVETSLEWRLDDQTSVQTTYDNINTSTTSSVGNVGVDVRWRLEFE